MKKTRLLVLTAMAALTLTGCGNASQNNKGGELPSGGKEVDVKTEDGKKSLNEHVGSAVKAYRDLNLTSASLKATLSGVNESASVKVATAADEEAGIPDLKANLDFNLKDFGAKLEVNAAKHAKGADDPYDYLDASANLSTTGGSLAIKGSLPGLEEGKTSKLDASLSLGGLSADAYLIGNKAYFNVDGNGNFFKGLDTFANKLYPSLLNSYVGMFLGTVEISETVFDAEKGVFNFASMYEELSPKKAYLELGQPVIWPTFSADNEETLLPAGIEDFNFADYLEAIKQFGIDLSLVTYKDLSFGLKLELNKESLKTLAGMFVASDQAGMINTVLDNYLTKFSLGASIFFNKDGLLESIGASYDVAFKMNDLSKLAPEAASMFKTFSVEAASSANFKVEIGYNDGKVVLPSASELAKYEKVELPVHEDYIYEDEEPIYIEG